MNTRLGAHWTNRFIASDEAKQVAIRLNPASILWTPWNDMQEIEWGLQQFLWARHILRLRFDFTLADIQQAHDSGIRCFQFGNEPSKEFLGPPREWNDLLREWLDKALVIFDDVTWLYSPMPVGPEWDDQNMEYWRDAADIIARPNIQVAAHAYWQPSDAMTDPTWGLHWQRVHEMYPDKDIYLTETGNTNPATPKAEKARQYVWYAKILPDYVRCCCIWGLDLTDDWEADQVNLTMEMAKIINSNEEETMPDIDLYEQWEAEYIKAHNGLHPADWEFYKHRLAIDANLPVTLADVKAAEEDVNSAHRQWELLKQRYVEGGPAPEPLTTGQQIVDEGRKWLGKLTYCWDGKDPAAGCLDCSGYLDVVWKAVTGDPVAGGGGTWWMLDKAIKMDQRIAVPDLQAGDIVFWDMDKMATAPSHVGIATGEGSVLECSLRWNGVTETPWEPEWAERFHSAWRIV